MFNIRIICVGKLKEKYWEAASAEYLKRLGAYCSASVIEIREEKLPAHASRADEENVIVKEGRAILEKVNAGDFVIALDIKGREMSSEAFAAKLADISFTASTVDLLIGGSLGLSAEVKSRADLRMSFGPVTLPHQLARIVLLEQVYRAFKINAGETYHK